MLTNEGTGTTCSLLSADEGQALTGGHHLPDDLPQQTRGSYNCCWLFTSMLGETPCCTATVPVPVQAQGNDKYRTAAQPHHQSCCYLHSSGQEHRACQPYQELSVP